MMMRRSRLATLTIALASGVGLLSLAGCYDEDEPPPVGYYAPPPPPPGYYGDPYATDYDAARYYHEDPRYGERHLSRDDYVYRGSDGRYYCRHSDGTTGLVVGGLGGAAIGNIIDGGHNRVAGTLIGGALGALAGKAIEQDNDVRCR